MSTPFIVVMLCGQSLSSHMVYNGVSRVVPIECVIMESSVSTRQLLKKRIKTLGFVTVLGQVLFMLLNSVLKRMSSRYTRHLIQLLGLDVSPIPEDKLFRVESANSHAVIERLKLLQPSVVIVNGTRILQPDVLKSVNGVFINTHVGITPKYRGVHGGYWALANGDSAHFGVTVHLVDEGIDTGSVLYQEIISVDSKDSFNTYPIKQIAHAIPLIVRAIEDSRVNRLTPKSGVLPSKLYSHPTVWGYLLRRIFKGVC